MQTMRYLGLILIFLFSLGFFSYRLLEVPTGLTIDEAGFGYNASLISETLRDENGRFLPVFVLSLDGRDWRQPVTQYFQVLVFKIFGGSVFNLKFTSVFVVSISALLIFILGRQLINNRFGFLALLIFLTTPIVMIHSHLALDNIMPIPFILIWLMGISMSEKRGSKFLVISAVSLGIGFYAHKSMRSAATVWAGLSLIYLIFTTVKDIKNISIENYKSVLLFAISILPFFVLAPVLDYKYAGAVFGTQNINTHSWYDFFNFYLSSFDLSFLFIEGDSIMHHSTGRHGMFLLASLPFFLYGIYRSIENKNIFFKFLLISFFAGPLLFGFVGSIHRASRLIFLVPVFCLISAFGIYKLLEIRNYIFKIGLLAACLLFIFNFVDFAKYYWFQYAQDTDNIFYKPRGIDAYKKLSEQGRLENLRPFIAKNLTNIEGDGGTIEDFARSLYFVRYETFNEASELPRNSILLSTDKNLKGLERIESGVDNYYLYKKN